MAGLSPNDHDNFAILPPHFEPSDLTDISEEDWCSVCPSYKAMPDGFKRAIPFLLASLFYHEQYYRETFHANHPIFLCPVFQGHNVKIQRLKTKVYCEVNQCTKTGLIATGVPMVFQLSIRLARLEAACGSSNAQVLATIQQLRSELPNAVSNT